MKTLQAALLSSQESGLRFVSYQIQIGQFSRPLHDRPGAAQRQNRPRAAWLSLSGEVRRLFSQGPTKTGL